MAAASIHIAHVGHFKFDAVGNALPQDLGTASIGAVMTSTSRHAVIPDVTVPNTAGYPTIEAYLIAEAAAGYVLRHMDQYLIVTYSTTVP